MTVELDRFVTDFAEGMRAADARRPVCNTSKYQFKPGIGPFPEAEAISLAAAEMCAVHGDCYSSMSPRRYEGSRSTCDLVLQDEWAFEFKLVRPFGDNGKEAEHWSQNLLHPYPGNVSLLADCLKLRDSKLAARKAVIAFGYEHTPPLISLEPTIRSFEVLAREVMRIVLRGRIAIEIKDLVHPVHQQVKVYGWEILS